MARRSAQLDDETHSVNLNMQLVNWRLEHINLPKDGLCEPEDAPGDAPRIKAGPGLVETETGAATANVSHCMSVGERTS
jgi:hypothetical protein